jgi:anti-sigma factor RsiW
MAHENCHDLLDELSAFLDGEASAEVCAEIQRHMADCRKCRVVVDTLRKTVTLYRRLPRPDLPGEAVERLYKVLDLSGCIRSTE